MPESTSPHVELTFLQGLADLERLEEPWSEILNAGDPEEAALIIRLLMAHMGVTGKRLLGAIGMEPDVCFPAPHRHAGGHDLTGQWKIPFITWEKPVTRLAAAQRLIQRQRIHADEDGAGLTPVTEEANVAALIQRFDVLPPQTAQRRDPRAEEIAALHHHKVTANEGSHLPDLFLRYEEDRLYRSGASGID
jgi:hypothetical protein|tara:strand:+ start:1064 stop:1639 length:576 start_codon:yes stop_codon:yes gene_type:complete